VEAMVVRRDSRQAMTEARRMQSPTAEVDAQAHRAAVGCMSAEEATMLEEVVAKVRRWVQEAWMMRRRRWHRRKWWVACCLTACVCGHPVATLQGVSLQRGFSRSTVSGNPLFPSQPPLRQNLAVGSLSPLCAQPSFSRANGRHGVV